MRKSLLLLAILSLTIACKENIEEKAAPHLNNAKEAFSVGNFNLAKQEIDSIRILYPKAFETRKQGIRLTQGRNEDFLHLQTSTSHTLADILLQRGTCNDIDEIGLEHLGLHTDRVNNTATANSELLRHDLLYFRVGINDTTVGVAHLVDGLVRKEFESVELQKHAIVY